MDDRDDERWMMVNGTGSHHPSSIIRYPSSLIDPPSPRRNGGSLSEGGQPS
jgi:hypothetical protein